MSDVDDSIKRIETLNKESAEMHARFERDMERHNDWVKRQDEIRHEKWLENSSKGNSSGSYDSNASYTPENTIPVKTWSYKETFAKMPATTIFATIGGVMGMIRGATLFGGPNGLFGLIIVLALAGTVGVITGGIGALIGAVIGLPIDGILYLVRKAVH